jgi:hypothetical protein
MTDQEIPTEVQAEIDAGRPIWDTETLQRDFKVEAFLAPFVCVVRKSDGAVGTLRFTHRPRHYYGFQKD